MRRSRTTPATADLLAGVSGGGRYAPTPAPVGALQPEDDGIAAASLIVRNIASFLTLSDVASLTTNAPTFSYPTWDSLDVPTPADSWAVGVELDHRDEIDDNELCSWSIATPLTPALMALSPGATPVMEYDTDESRSEVFQNVLQERRRRWAQDKLSHAIFAHPLPLRNYCWEAYEKAQEIRTTQAEKWQELQKHRVDPETFVEPTGCIVELQHAPNRLKLLNDAIDLLFHNVPLSVLIDVVDAIGDTALDSTFATVKLSVAVLNHIVSALGRLVQGLWHGVTNFNPLQLLETIISLQFNAMGKTSEALVGGIQSVATGVGSASSLALHRLSAANLAGHTSVSNASLRTGGGEHTGGLFSRKRAPKQATALNQKTLEKLSAINAAARLVDYTETSDDTGGLTQHAKSRVQRSMHYNVSLRPFVATVEAPSQGIALEANDGEQSLNFDAFDLRTRSVSFDDSVRLGISRPLESPSLDDLEDSSSSSFLCTPQSFPSTPHSRQTVMAQWCRRVDDAIFNARDKLRVYDGLESSDERTRGMAELLSGGKKLAVFDDQDTHGIELTCGKHVATKVGSMLYCNVRSAVAILRNSFVYSEITVLPRPVTGTTPPSSSMVTLSIGLATAEMPPNTLVGAWQGSAGLCSTGQILAAGQWCTPIDPRQSAYGEGTTVGCLAFLDEDSALETWDGVMVTARIILNVNGVLVIPSVSPVAGLGAAAVMTPSFDSEEDEAIGYDSNKASNSQILSLLVPSAEDLYPTITLHSPATAVMCRFSAEDVTAVDRECIGAPPGVAIYAADGSVIFDERD